MRAIALVVALFVSAASAWAALPADAERRKETGNYHLKQRQYEAARDQYLAALKLAPEYSDVHYNLGVLYFFRLGDYPRALYHFVRYARLQPDASDLGQVQALTAQALEKIETAERAAYAEILRSGTVGALEAFRRAHPQSPYSDDAERKLRLLAEHDREVRRRKQATREAYDRGVARATPGAMDEFLHAHPGAPQSAAATRLRDLWAGQRADDEKAFLAALDQGTAAALAAFLKERPQSAYVPEAQKQLQQLRTAEQGSAAAATAAALAAADQAWQDATAADSVAAYEAFLEENPDHARAPQSRDRIATLKQQAEAAQLRDEADRVWRAVEGANRSATYRDFAVAYPDHPNTAEAGRRATALETAAVEAQARAAVEEARVAADRAWESATRKDTLAAYQGFLAAHPDHSQTGKAERNIRKLEKQAAEAEETAAREATDRAWRDAERADTIEAHQNFIAAHPEHGRAGGGRKRISALEDEATAAAWRKARDTDTVAAYENFLRGNPDAEEAAAARSRLSELRETQRQSSPESQLSSSKRRALDRYQRMLTNE